MAMLPSHAHVDLILNGTRIDTWADDDPPYDLETDDSANLTTGKAGRKYGNGEANFGGRLMIRLAPHSPGVKWLIEKEIERKKLLDPRGDGAGRGFAQVFNGTLKDVVAQIDVKLTGGTIIKIPPRTIAGQTFEATFDFEIVESNVDSQVWSTLGSYPGSNVAGANPNPNG